MKLAALTVISVLLNIAFGFLLFLCLKISFKLEEENNDLKKRNKEYEKIDKKTEQQIESITTGNINNDVHAGVNILHDLSQKRK